LSPVRPGVRRVLLCGYRRFIIDEVACYRLPAGGAIGTHTVLRGSYRVTVLAGDSPVGRPMRIRIR